MRPAADSIQWEFINLSSKMIDEIIINLENIGIKIVVFNGSNARSFWNWSFFEQNEKCPFTKKLISRSVDFRIEEGLSLEDLNIIGNAILNATNNINREEVC